jgi:hypothetical protein
MAEAQKFKLIDGWEVVIGIEIHTQLATNLKFSQVHRLNLVKTQIHKRALLTWLCRVYCLY